VEPQLIGQPAHQVGPRSLGRKPNEAAPGTQGLPKEPWQTPYTDANGYAQGVDNGTEGQVLTAHGDAPPTYEDAATPSTTLTKNTTGASLTAGAEADWWAYAVAGGTLGTGTILRLTLEGQIANVTGASHTVDVRVYYGATLIGWMHVTGLATSTTGADGYAFTLQGTLAAHGATNAQRSAFLFSLGGVDSGNDPPNTGVLNTATATSSHRSIGEDSTAAKTLKVTGQASGNLGFTAFHVLLETF
jgi:hypothetical protein